MNLPVVQPPRCLRCSSILEPPGSLCGRCGLDQKAAARPVVPAYGPVVPKSPGTAVALSVLVLGGGFLYLNRTGPGIALIAWDVVLFLITLIPFIGWVMGPLLWLVSLAIVAPLTASAAKEHNRALLGS